MPVACCKGSSVSRARMALLGACLRAHGRLPGLLGGACCDLGGRACAHVLLVLREPACAQLSLRFTEEQKAELLRARRIYFMRVSPLLQERSIIQGRLHVRLPCLHQPFVCLELCVMCVLWSLCGLQGSAKWLKH